MEEELYRLQKFYESCIQKYDSFFVKLFSSATNSWLIHSLFSLLRAEGIRGGDWDPFREAKKNFEEDIKYFKKVENIRNRKNIRFALQFYCDSTEILSLWEVLMNLYRVKNGKPYFYNPLNYDPETSELKPLHSVATKLERLKKEAKDKELDEILLEVYNNKLRRSFIHKKYCLNRESYIAPGENFSQKNNPRVLTSIVPTEEIWEQIICGICFVESFFHHHDNILAEMTNLPQFYKLGRYEVFEIIKTKKRVKGFKWHFPNGTVSHFERQISGDTIAINLIFNPDITLLVGDLDLLKKSKKWKINNRPVREFNEGSAEFLYSR